MVEIGFHSVELAKGLFSTRPVINEDFLTHWLGVCTLVERFFSFYS